MNKSKGIPIVAGLILALGLSNSARAQDWTITGQAGISETGKGYPMGTGHVVFMAEGHGTFFNDKGEGSLLNRAGFKYLEVCNIDTSTKTGSCGGPQLFSDGANGEATLNWHCTLDKVPPTQCHGTLEWTGGTGKYAGINGTMPFTAHPTIFWDDNSSNGWATWNR